MSKKKATMTLKDFHGGSIPSDLPLPSAPGLVVRPSDRAGYDRQTSWGNPMGRSEHRLRPSSAGAVRSFDDKTPFLSHSAHIGRNFDEDERKPLDGVSAPRRTISDDSIRALPASVEPKSDYLSTAKVPTLPVSTMVPHTSSGGATSYAARFSEANHVGVNSLNFGGNSGNPVAVNYQNMGGNSGQAVAGSYPNAWGLRKEAVGIAEPIPTTLSAPDAASKLAHASALEKVSSGRWHTKQPIHHQTDVEVMRHPETECEFHSKGNNMYNKNTYNVMDMAGGREYQDVTLAMHAERSLAVDDDIQDCGKEFPTYERTRSPLYTETRERNPPLYADRLHQARNASKFVALDLQSPAPLESSERPKLKLVPISKPHDGSELPVEYKQGYQQPSDPGHVESVGESHGNAYFMKPGLAGPESGNRVVDRPKLNLKPRSQPLEQLEANIERGRNTLFGGARPRELVLKERGIDDVAVNNPDLVQLPSRVKQDVPRTETVPMRATPMRYNEKVENIPLDHRIRKNNDRRDQRVDIERTDVQRKNWRSENRRNSRENEKQQQQQQPQERLPSPETWRKPVEQLKPTFPDAPGVRYGKAASAVDLAQAFSRSISDPKAADQFSGQRGLPSRGQMPFSRLTGPSPRSQINGY